MVSTPTTRLRVERQALGENSATWGAPKLNAAFDRFDEAIAGVTSIAIGSTTTTLSSTNYATDQSRYACIVFTGTLSGISTIVVPNSEKLYLIVNNTTMGAYTLTIKTAAGAGVSLATGPQWVFCTGTSVFTGTPRLDQLGTAAAALNMGGYKITNGAVPTLSGDFATKGYVDGIAVGVDASAAVAALQASTDAALATLAPKAAPSFTSGVTVSTGVVLAPVGSAASPTYSFSSDTNSGLYSYGSDVIGIATGGSARLAVDVNGLTVGTGGCLLPAGSASAPAYTFALDSNTGMYNSAADTLSFTTGGTLRASISSSGLAVTALSATGAATVGTTLGVTGATTLSSTCAISGAATVGSTLGVTGATTLSSTLGVSGASTFTSGTFSSTLGVTGATTLSSTLGVTGAATLSSTCAVTGAVTAGGVIQGPAGSVSAPSHSFSTDTNSGMYSGGADIVRLTTGGVDRLAIDASGHVGIGYTTPPTDATYRFFSVKGDTGGASIRVTSGTNTKQGIFQIASSAGDISFGTDVINNSTGKLDLLSGGGVKATITAAGELMVGQSATITPGYSLGASTLGIGLWGATGRAFISQDSFSNWNSSTTGTLISICQGGTQVGSISVTGSTTSYATSSDYRLKTDIQPLTGAMDRLAGLKPSRFKFKRDPATTYDGFIAHEVSEICPDAVFGEKDGEQMQALDASKLIPLLVGAVQELARRVDALEDQV